MRLSHFAKLEVIVPPTDYKPEGQDVTGASLKTVGMAQNINIDDNFGSRAENTIGTPLPVLAPGYQQTTITIEKATIDGADFRNLGAFNPLWAHVGLTYTSKITGGALISSEVLDSTRDGMYPFMFILRTRNKISNSATLSNITETNEPSGAAGLNGRPNSFGVYACVLSSASISATSQQAIIMDRVTAIARPVSGTWLNKTIKDAFRGPGGRDSESFQNGMQSLVYDLLYGYVS